MPSEKLVFLAIIFIFIGILMLIISSITSLTEKGKSKTDFAFGGFIGPIPIGFFSSKQAFWLWIVIAAVFIIISILSKIQNF